MKKYLSLIIAIFFFMVGVVCGETAKEWWNKGDKAYNEGRFHEAIVCFEKVKKILIENKYDSEHLHYKLGLAYYKARILKDAENELIIVTLMNPYHESAHYYLGCVYEKLGDIYEKEGRLDEEIDMTYDAKSEYKKALELKLNPYHKRAIRKLGDIYEKEERLDEGISEYKKYLIKNPNDWFVYYKLVFSYLKEGSYKLALENLPKIGLICLKNFLKYIAETGLTLVVGLMMLVLIIMSSLLFQLLVMVKRLLLKILKRKESN